MKLNINPKELLALHNLLHERFCDYPGGGPADPNARSADDIQLHQVYNRLRSIVVASLSNQRSNPVEQFEAFFNKEQAKIDKLKEQNDDIKKEQAGLAEQLGVQPADFDGDDDYVVPDYPRRGPRNRGGNRGGNKR
jgi:hypothetical protein